MDHQETAANPRREVFDRMAATWDTLPKSPDMEALLMQVAAAGQISASGRVLDVGTGTGGLLPYLRNAGAIEVVAIDISTEMLLKVKERFGEQVWPVCADAECLPFPPTTFDTIFCHGVYPHFNNPGLVLANAHRTLQPGGHLVISLPGSREKINAIHAGHPSPALQHDLMPPAAELCEQLAKSGWRVERSLDKSDFYLVVAVRQ